MSQRDAPVAPCTYETDVPCYEPDGDGSVRRWKKETVIHMGLTKREYYAASILQGLLARPGLGCFDSDSVSIAVTTADELIKELEK